MLACHTQTLIDINYEINSFQIGKGVCQGYILSTCIYNIHAEYIMQNVRLDEAQTGVMIPRKNINNLRYVTTLTALKSLLMKVKEESEKSGFKLNVQKMKIKASGSIASWQIDGETMEMKHNRLYFLGLQNHCRW